MREEHVEPEVSASKMVVDAPESDGEAGRRGSPPSLPPWSRWVYALVGVASIVWFLVRVIPKPSRATYPCQRAAFPIASNFVIWLVGAFASLAVVHKARKYLWDARYIGAVSLLAVAGCVVWLTSSLTDDTPVMADPPVVNQPLGVAKGLFPGRVAWVHDPEVTDWDGGTGDGGWWYEHIDAGVTARMMSRALRGYAGVDDEPTAWELIFRHFNRESGKGDVGYVGGEKIAIKLNLVACFAKDNRVDASYDKKVAWKDNIDNPPELLWALLDQLVNVAGVDQADITIGDPSSLFPNYIYEPLHADFPGVRYWDNRGTLGRTKAEYSSNRFYWSKGGLGETRQDYVPVAFAEASYLINFALLKSHESGGITVCAKNHYGSMVRLPPGDYQNSSGVWQSPPSSPAYYPFHDDLPDRLSASSRYRNRVDFMAHADVGQKTFLYLIDGIIAGRNWRAEPEPWSLAPFDESGGWPSSLFLSMDPVAIDSVALDFLIEQWPEHAGRAGTTDHLIEAALANDPPSGTFYDPNHAGDVSRAASLGVYERWNSPAAKQYTRNLDPDLGTGIELLRVEDDTSMLTRTEYAPVIDGDVEGLWNATMWRTFANLVDPLGGAHPQADDLSGRWKLLWDTSSLYFLVEVTDDQLVHSPVHDDKYWLDDNVEIFIDADNSKGGGNPMPNYDGLNDFEFGFRWGDPEVRIGNHSVDDTRNIEFVMEAAADGYRLEAVIPWSTLRARPDGLPPVSAGMVFGLDVHITDNDELGDEDRDFKLAWHADIDDTWRDTSILATVSLGKPAVETDERFVRGEANGDGRLDISDPVRVLLVLFGGVEPGDCQDALDVDDSGSLDITDPILLLGYLFRSGAPPAAPFPVAGRDPTPDGLPCERR